MKLTEATRHYIYGIALAVIAALAAYGILGPDEIPVWVGIVVAVLGIGTNALAVKNTQGAWPPPPPNEPWRDRGESTLITILVILAIVVLVLFILGRASL